MRSLLLVPDRRRVANNQQGRQQLVAGQEGRRSRIRRTHPVARVAGVEDGDAGMLMMMIFCVVVSDVRFHDIQYMNSVQILRNNFK